MDRGTPTKLAVEEQTVDWSTVGSLKGKAYQSHYHLTCL